MDPEENVADSSALLPMRTWLAWACVFVVMVTGCSRERTEPPDARESFQQLLSEFQERARKKVTDQLAITVTELLDAETHPSEPRTGTIRVRKQMPSGVAGNPKMTAEVIDVYFTHEQGRWRCLRAVSKDFEGDRILGQNSIDGPDIRLANLFRWLGL